MTTTIDTRSLAPYAPGRFVFRFKWADMDRVQVTYTARHHRRDLKISCEITHSLASTFRADWEAGRLDPSSAFIRYFFGDVPGAVGDWGHVCHVAAMTPEESRH